MGSSTNGMSRGSPTDSQCFPRQVIAHSINLDARDLDKGVRS